MNLHRVYPITHIANEFIPNIQYYDETINRLISTGKLFKRRMTS